MSERYTLPEPSWQWHPDGHFTLDLSWDIDAGEFSGGRYLHAGREATVVGQPDTWTLTLCEDDGGVLRMERLGRWLAVSPALATGYNRRAEFNREPVDASPI